MIEEVTITSIDQLIGELNAFRNHFFFRGQANAAWNLQSSLERVLGGSWSSDRARKFEDFSLSSFKSKFHLYDRENIQPSSKLSWLAIMQHYGVPTRLIDFTESPYVALYFGMESYSPDLGHDLAVFAIDYTALMDQSLAEIASKDSSFRETRESLHEKRDTVFDTIVDRFAYDIAWTTEPTQLNTRLDRQAGSFLVSGNRGMRIGEVLDSALYASVSMKKLVVSHILYPACFALLRKMNINSKSLYGDLDGLARSIRMEMQVYSTNP